MIDVLDLHRRLVAIRSVSHHEAEICNFVQSYLSDYGVETQRIGDNVAARAGKGPMLVLNSHLDTVPPTEAWTREPWKVTIQGGKVYGLGANDAKASVAAMIATFIRAKKNGANLGLLLACEEETGGKGTEFAWPILQEQGWDARGVVVGEPTGLNIATSQKGMLLLELHSHGDACHAANATAMGATNAITELARDLVAIHDVDLGPAHPHLGGTTLQPTVLTGGRVRNQTPHHAHAVVDLRTVPRGCRRRPGRPSCPTRVRAVRLSNDVRPGLLPRFTRYQGGSRQERAQSPTRRVRDGDRSARRRGVLRGASKRVLRGAGRVGPRYSAPTTFVTGT